MIDLDNLKRINDRQGRRSGDAALDSVRSADAEGRARVGPM